MADFNKVIGGEFAVDPQFLNRQSASTSSLGGCYKYSSGRSALFFILLDIKTRFGINKVLFPDYFCSSVVVAAKSADVEVVFYELDERLKINHNSFINIYDTDYAVLIINYFGLQDISDDVDYVRSLNSSAIIIEDDVQAYYEFAQDLSSQDYKFTSLRKTFACPDGGLVKTNHNLHLITEENRFYQYKLAGSMLKSLSKPAYYEDDIFMHLLEQGEEFIDNDINKGISNVAVDIMSKTDTESVSTIRRNNAKIIIDGLNTLGIKSILTLSEKKTPLFIPVYLDDRNKVRRSMFQHNVFCPVHWPLVEMNVKKGVEMAEHEMSIIVDQRYNNTDMLFILELIEKAIK